MQCRGVRETAILNHSRGVQRPVATCGALPLFGDQKPVPIARTPANEEFPRLSPDGRWMALASDESGRYEIYVQSFPGPGPKVQISTEGVQGGPQWRGDEREIFYASIDDGRQGIPDYHSAELVRRPSVASAPVSARSG